MAIVSVFLKDQQPTQGTAGSGILIHTTSVKVSLSFVSNYMPLLSNKASHMLTKYLYLSSNKLTP